MQSELKSSFNQKFNVFSSIIISNKELRSTDKVQYISDSIDTVIQSKSSIEEICLLMRSETEKGHSIEFSIRLDNYYNSSSLEDYDCYISKCDYQLSIL